MFLDTLRLNNFRSFEDEQICFGKDLTILVGENNGRKSNTIDALRLITTPLSGRREIYCESSDIRFGGAEPKFEVQATFSDLSAVSYTHLQQLHLPIHSADDLKYSLTFIHQFCLQWPGMGDSSIVSTSHGASLIDGL